MPSLARKYTKRVVISRIETTPDGFGGGTTEPVQDQMRWCRVDSVSRESATQYRSSFGLKSDARILRFTFRYFDFDIKTGMLYYDNDFWSPLVVEDHDQYKTELVVIAQANFQIF